MILFDRSNDPGETVNLAADTAYAEILEECWTKLETLITAEIGEDLSPWVTEKPQLLGWPTWRGDTAA